MVATCFLFAETFGEVGSGSDSREGGCFSLTLDERGEVAESLAFRRFADIKTIQKNAKTVVVLPANRCGFHTLALPWLPERKARLAIPFAIEEQLAQPVHTTHVALDKHHYHDGEYLVAVTDKGQLASLIETLTDADVAFDMVTVDWFALALNEACITPYGFMASAPQFKGALSDSLLAQLKAVVPETTPLWSFSDSRPVDLDHPLNRVPIPYQEWIAKRLIKAHPMNLCQGTFERRKSASVSRFWYTLSGALAAAWLVAFLVLHGMQLHVLHKKNALLDEQIATRYRVFFPQAKQVISPQFRISQLLRTGASGGDSGLWVLVGKLAATLTRHVTIEQIQYQNQRLQVMLTSKDFAALEALEQALQNSQIQVKQLQASSQDDKVMATLELSL